MSLEDAVRSGLKSAKYFSGFLWGATLVVFLLMRADPRFLPEPLDYVFGSLMVGLSLGATASWDTVKVNVKKLLQSSETTEAEE